MVPTSLNDFMILFYVFVFIERKVTAKVIRFINLIYNYIVLISQ